MRMLRAFVALAGLIVPPALIALFAWWLYDWRIVTGVIVFFVLLAAWSEGLRALRRMD